MSYTDDDYRPTYTYFGTLKMTGFHHAELYTYYNEVGELRIDVRGPYYPFDVPGGNTLAESLHFIACNLHRCEFAANGSGQAYDESRLPGRTLDINLFDYYIRRQHFGEPEQVKLCAEDGRDAYKDKTWEYLVTQGMLEVDIEFRYV